jgi:hypothetical protein
MWLYGRALWLFRRDGDSAGARARVLRTVPHLEGDDLSLNLGHQVDLPVLLAAPIGEAHVLRVDTRLGESTY